MTISSLFLYGNRVRYGFGFYNPNHAAAFICAVMPFLLGWRRHAWIGGLLFICLAFPLALTFSRTGAVVIGLELLIFLWSNNRTRATRNWSILIASSVVAIFISTGVIGRFSVDKEAILNRPRIWRAGLQLAPPRGRPACC